MEQTCNGLNCNKVYPRDSGRWYYNLGIQTGKGEVDEKGDYKLDYAKMCGECFDKLNEKEKQRWIFLEEIK